MGNMARPPIASCRIVRGGHDNAAVPSPAYTALSLYAGAGGLDLGFREAKFELVWAIDSDEQAVETYKANLGDHIVRGELPDDGPPADLRPDVKEPVDVP